MKIVVIGGTGLIGSKAVSILRNAGHDVVAASPRNGINAVTGVEEFSLVPLGEARLGRIGLDEWLRRGRAPA